MKPTITLDKRQFTAASRELFKTSSRTCVDFTNGQALKASIESVRHTEKVDAAKIQAELGAIAREVSFKQISRGSKKGQWRTKRGGFVTRENSLASRILGWRMREKGSFGIAGTTEEQRVTNFINSRVRSRSFIASGWIAARNKLFSIVRNKPAKMRSVADARAYGKPKGDAQPAVFSLRGKIEARIENTALLTQSKEPSKGRNPMSTAVKGLQAGLNATARDMLAELARRLNPDFKKVSAK